MWNNRSSPSNLSPFTIFELDPLSMTQMARCLHLHLLSKNTEAKLMDEIKASQIQESKVPAMFKGLHQTLLFYLGITSILFGSDCTLISGVKLIAAAIKTKKIIFKGHIAADSDLPTKKMYAMEIRIQRWLGKCQKFSDRSMVNDRLVSFDNVFEMVMNSSLNVIFPPNFIKPPPKIHRPSQTPRRGTTASKREKGRKGSQTKPKESASPRTPPPSPSF